jgi:transcriptional regulator with XRE-family HTH domain
MRDKSDEISYTPAVARTSAAPDGELGSWLRLLRERSGLSQTELAATVGTDRRNIRRWEVEGHDPGGSMLMQILSALGVEVTPSPPGRMPRAVNAELRELEHRLSDVESRAARRHDELMALLGAHEEELRTLATRVRSTNSHHE